MRISRRLCTALIAASLIAASPIAASLIPALRLAAQQAPPAPVTGHVPLTFPTDDPVIKRIWSVGMDSSMTERLAQVLFDSIGPRLTGSPGFASASDWVVSQYKAWGIDARRDAYGTWRGWRRGLSHVDLVGPRVRSLEGTMLAWSPGAKGKSVTAEAILLPKFKDSTEFVKWLPQASGKIVLLSPSWPTCRPSEGLVPLRHAGVEGAHGFPREYLAPQGTGGWGVIEIFETYNTVAPAMTLTCEDYSLVYRLAAHGQKPMVRIEADADLLGEVPAFNTIATIRGREKPDEYVILSAHFDSWDGSSGATDNGTGTLMAMEAMRILKKVYPTPRRTIIVGHWASEEQGLNGSRAFASDHPEVMRGLQALFNQDNGTGRVQSLSAAGLTNIGPHLRDWYAKLPSFYADSMSANVVSWSFRDTYDKVVLDDLKHNATLAAMLAYLASEDPTFIDRTRSPGTWPADWPANCGNAPRKTNPRF